MALAGVLALGGMAAEAATVTFDFTGGTGVHKPSILFSQDGLDLTVSATHYQQSTGLLTDGGKVAWADGGLGERSGPNDSTLKLDGLGRNELLLFSFSSDVILESVTFAAVDDGSLAAGFLNGTFTGAGAILPSFDLSSLSALTDNFGLGAGSKTSAFRIASITVSTVPLPAGGALLLSALALPFLRRRRRA